MVGADDLDRSKHQAMPDGRQAERLELVRSLLRHFDDRTNACVIHFYVDEMSKAEVARVTGLSVPTVRKYLNRFLAKAKVILDQRLEARAMVEGG